MIHQFKLIFFLVIAVSFSATAQDSTSADYFKKGDYYYRNFDYNLAVEYFDKAIKLDPGNINALLERGFSRNILKDYAGATSDFTEVIKLNPDHRWAYISRGSSRNKTGDYVLAIEDFNKALELDPTDQEAYNNRGFSKKMSGDKEGACADWNKSKKLGNEEAKIILKNNHCK
jgi:tetratricopeptide (TPR) repeat protein